MVFAEHGYAKSSVDEIIKAADISKGSLFYYFESKKNFFVYLYEYSGRKMEQLIDSPGPEGKPSYMEYTDFFERLNAVHCLKLRCSLEHPHMNRFMKRAAFETAPAVRQTITAVNSRYTKERATLFFQELDCSKFKEGIDPKMVIQLLAWTSEGCANQMLGEPAPDFNELNRLYFSYVEMFRKNFYKEEYL